jgi:hypothetical protein
LIALFSMMVVVEATAWLGPSIVSFFCVLLLMMSGWVLYYFPVDEQRDWLCYHLQ